MSEPKDDTPPLLPPGRRMAEMVKIDAPEGWTEYAPGEGPKRAHLPTHGELTAEIDRLRTERDGLIAFMDGVRDAARNRNPEGVTLLDFMACWNEQYEARVKQLREANAALAAACEHASQAIEIHHAYGYMPGDPLGSALTILRAALAKHKGG